ncbi:MAG TPA: AsmA-like C-terminal region-containing protein, partial [Candidatus Hydrogenedentes bacterium]|nr:AsmA-like C-terminal region-containing protein [Candidatus Hydrogenedentota bacterium]
ELSADAMQMPPWTGSQFKGTVYNEGEKTGLSHFEAVVDGGRLEGSYDRDKKTNYYTLKATWDGIPARYVIRHLELPEILDGPMSGWVDYSMDADDPATLQGKGTFHVRNGNFVPATLAATFGEQFAEFAQLQPEAYAFTTTKSDIALKGDHIRTDNMLVELPGITLTGSGTWITGGDIDYRVDVSITPDTAAEIPILAQSFNIQGYRIAQRNVDLGFQIKGPAFKPTSQLAGMPDMGVTLVSGAAEMTNEAVRVIDLPRQLFISLIKTGGGILGASRTGETGAASSRRPSSP